MTIANLPLPVRAVDGPTRALTATARHPMKDPSSDDLACQPTPTARHSEPVMNGSRPVRAGVTGIDPVPASGREIRVHVPAGDLARRRGAPSGLTVAVHGTVSNDGANTTSPAAAMPCPRRAALHTMGIAAAIASVLAATPARADDGERTEPTPTLVVRGPAVADVLTAAYRAAGLDRDPSRGWNARARVAGLVPWITVRTGRDTNWKNTDTDVGHGMVVEVRATWRLDRLVFDGRELQVASVEAARRRERRRLASRVIRAYFAWRRAVERTGERPDCDPADPAADPAGRGCASRAALVDEAAAELDALTDGWFSDALADPPALSRGFSGRPSRRTASENRTR